MTIDNFFNLFNFKINYWSLKVDKTKHLPQGDIVGTTDKGTSRCMWQTRGDCESDTYILCGGVTAVWVGVKWRVFPPCALVITVFLLHCSCNDTDTPLVTRHQIEKSVLYVQKHCSINGSKCWWENSTKLVILWNIQSTESENATLEQKYFEVKVSKMTATPNWLTSVQWLIHPTDNHIISCCFRSHWSNYNNNKALLPYSMCITWWIGM